MVVKRATNERAVMVLTQEKVTLKKIPGKEKEEDGQQHFFHTHFSRIIPVALLSRLEYWHNIENAANSYQYFSE